MAECDVVSIAGGRSEDISTYLMSRSLEKYWYLIKFRGGNDLSETVKGTRRRAARTPGTTKNTIDSISHYLIDS